LSRKPYALKRPLDVAVASTLLVATSPLWLGAALGTLLTVGRPVLFRQQRPGLNARPFTLLKFRTMRQVSATDPVSSDAVRLTPFGKLLRKTSVDELPSLLNVLAGEMSLVGPRPLLMAYLPRYDRVQARRHEVQPGLTGWAQVNGRNTLSWQRKFELDVYYVEHQSLRFDLWILWLTALHVLQPSGVSAEGHATMPEFMGNGPSAAPEIASSSKH
jgi:lipopolysaccharide/colanic/teichoic acid biosynthesis glycosyltransferase